MATTFDPFRDMERVLQQAYRQGSSTPGMPLDLYRQGDVFVAYLDMPGIGAEDIEIDVEDRMLTVRAQRKVPAAKDIEWLAHERPSGTYARQLSVGYGVALDKIEAEYQDGVLKLTIPVAEEAKPRKIQVKAKGVDAKTIDA